MKTNKLLVILAVVVLVLEAAQSWAQGSSRISSYYSNVDFLLSTPGAEGSAIGGFVNPAVYRMMPGPELQFFWSDDRAKLNSLKNWGLFTGVPRVGFGLVRRTMIVPVTGDQNTEMGVTDYRIALAEGTESMSFGLGYGWSKGYPDTSPRDEIFQMGTLLRPSPYASIGITGAIGLGSSSRKCVLDVALRPLRHPMVTLFGDAEIGERDRPGDAHWGAGAVFELLPGLRLVGKYLDTEAFTLGLSFSFGGLNLSSAPHYDDEKHLGYTTYGIRVGDPRRNIFDQYFRKKSRYLSMELKGTVAYRKYRFFDDETHTLSGILFDLEHAIDDPRVAGVALNLSGMSVPRVMAWEIREKLKAVRGAGKGVVIFIDRAGMKEYHLASVAHRIVMDPEGMIILPGHLIGHTYLRGTLDKLGLGVDEWRYFKYKSAFEVLSRESMSEADREQLQALVDDFYAVSRDDICASRDISPKEFATWVDSMALFLADSALTYGLVDTLARWDSREDIVASLEGRGKKMVDRDRLAASEFPSPDWGEKPRVAIVYGLGGCEMDRGIKARQLERIFHKVELDERVKAVVFRVDSPGGDGLASDVVAEALRKCATEKPVIVSQGNVAASGGYWISMYGDTIVAAPGTVTGSIGVIGGWVWNKDFGSKIGLKYDHVQAGDHADFDGGITLPFLRFSVPDRNLTPWERQQVEAAIKAMYRGFVAKVSIGRGLTEERVDAVGQGRVWSGLDGLENGLVDVIGGLDTAVSLAKAAAGIPAERKVKIVEMPGKGLFKPPFGQDDNPLIDVRNNREWEYLKVLMDHPAQPLPITPPDLYPE